jgi:hypothetical protein
LVHLRKNEEDNVAEVGSHAEEKTTSQIVLGLVRYRRKHMLSLSA